jgi:hypothetical protein
MTRTGRTSSPRGPLGRPPGGSGSCRNSARGSRSNPARIDSKRGGGPPPAGPRSPAGNHPASR